MKVYNVGPDQEHPGNEYDEKFVWMVVCYESYDEYSGGGEAVALGYDGMLYFKGLSHCSCYGPFEELENGQFEKVSVEDYLKSDSIHDIDTENNKIRNKVIKLLGEKKVDDTKYVLTFQDAFYNSFFFKRDAESCPCIDDATLMSLDEAEKAYESILKTATRSFGWHIWSVKFVPQLCEENTRHKIKTEIVPVPVRSPFTTPFSKISPSRAWYCLSKLFISVYILHFRTCLLISIS